MEYNMDVAGKTTSLTRSCRRVDREGIKLTDAQEAFCQLVAEDNMTLIDAYQLAYPNDRSNRNTMGANASRLHCKDSIQKRIELLRNAIVARCPVTKLEAMSRLADVIRGEDDQLAIQAIRELKTMVPEWVVPDDKLPEGIRITVVSEGRDRPTRQLPGQQDPDHLTIDVDAQQVIDSQ